MTNNTDLTAERIIDLQYGEEVYDRASLRGFLDAYLGATSPALIPEDLDDQRATLIDAIDDDIKDLLSNGGELLDEDDDFELVQDDGYRRGIATIIANKLLARI